MAVAIYVRVSTEEQRERQSIRTQREFADRYCEFHRHPVYRVYADDGVSGTVAMVSRPDGSQILRDARAKKFDQLLVYRLDRLGRDTRLILNAVDELEKLGVRVRSMTEEFDTANPTGRLMLTMLSGFATHEREVIRERSVAGTQRVAGAGAWLGGIVPYGYRKVGEKQTSRLVVSDEPIPGLALSEADVIREVFRMAAVEQNSCRVIAERLNQINAPCAYARDERLLLRGKRKQATSGIWTAGRVRQFLTNKTYAGHHEYGKRTKSSRQVIIRPVPALVSEETLQKAQETLRTNFLFGVRSARRSYLLRGLIKCGLCGRTYIGTATTRPSGKQEFYYRCHSVHAPMLRRDGVRCGSKAVRGDLLEQQVWADVEAFVRNPAEVLEKLQDRLRGEPGDAEDTLKQIAQLGGLIAQKGTERGRVIGLFRRGRVSEADLDAQLDEIGKEESALQSQLEEKRRDIAPSDGDHSATEKASDLLADIGDCLDGPVSDEVKRRLIEVLVAGVRVDTIESEGGRQTKTSVTYRFAPRSLPLNLVAPEVRGVARARETGAPVTVGDHIRKRRLELMLLQREAAERIGVTECSVYNWENGVSSPDFRKLPAIIAFLGYNPVPEPTGEAERRVWQRRSLGLSQREAAVGYGCGSVDPGTLRAGGAVASPTQVDLS